MSVLIIAKFPGDTAVFKKALADRVSELAQTGEQARQAGCIHHRFGVGDGFVIVVDEWESAQRFEQFIGQPHMQALIGEMGASGPPDVTIADTISSPDEF